MHYKRVMAFFKMNILKTILPLLFLSLVSEASCPPESELSKDAQRILQQFRMVQKNRGNPKTRPVFLKEHGHVAGLFIVNPDLPERLKAGVFASKEYQAWLRFSTDTIPQTPDTEGDTAGLGIKLMGVTENETAR